MDSEKATTRHSSVLAWRIPGTGEHGGLPSMGSHRVGHDWSDLAAAAMDWIHMLFRGNLNRWTAREIPSLNLLKYWSYESQVCLFSWLIFIVVVFVLWLSGKESACQHRRVRFDPWIGKIPWRRKWHPTPVLFPGKSHGQRSLAGYTPCSLKEPKWLSK